MQTAGRAVDRERESMKYLYVHTLLHVHTYVGGGGEGGWWHRILKTKDREKRKREKKKI